MSVDCRGVSTVDALAAVAVAGAASAQVTLYGKVDLGYGTTTNKTGAGTTTNKTSGMQSGFESGSRWGMKGSEDLGGGLTASFNYEFGSIKANEGKNGGDPARRSVVELSGSFGKVGMGRDYNPTFSMIGATDVTGVDNSSTSDTGALAGVRDSNMFLYTSPNFGGVTVKAGLISQRTGLNTNTSKVSGTDLSATYADGPLMVGLAYRVIKTTSPATAATWKLDANGVAVVDQAAALASTEKTKQTTLGATYDFGVAKAYFNYITGKVDGVSGTDKETNLGVSAPMGAVTLLAGLGRDSSTGLKSATDYTLGADYSLSKRTNVYARVYKQATVGNGGKTSGMAAGVRHSF